MKKKAPARGKLRGIKCKRTVQFIEAYIEGDLPSEMRDRFDDHLEECPGCVIFIKTYKKTMRVAPKALGIPDVPKDVFQMVLGVLRDSAAGKRTKK